MSQKRTIIFKHEDEVNGVAVGPIFWKDTEEYVHDSDEWMSRSEAKAQCEKLNAEFEEF